MSYLSLALFMRVKFITAWPASFAYTVTLQLDTEGSPQIDSPFVSTKCPLLTEILT